MLKSVNHQGRFERNVRKRKDNSPSKEVFELSIFVVKDGKKPKSSHCLIRRAYEYVCHKFVKRTLSREREKLSNEYVKTKL